MSVSVLVLTLNEEVNIDECLKSLSWADDIIVLDSLSSDQTTAIAQQCGARVVQRPFDNWSAHQNWAVTNIAFKNPWVLYFDADERCSVELAEEIRARIATSPSESAFRLRRKDFYMGRWLKHAQLYPTWLIRLFRPERIRYERLVNPVAVVDGSIGALRGHIEHFPFSHGVAHWIARHNKYSDMEAQELLKVRRGNDAGIGLVLSRDPVVRRGALKRLFYKMPARPTLKFLYYYILRRGFLDGQAGLTYSRLQALYEYMIDCKYRELVRCEKGLPI